MQPLAREGKALYLLIDQSSSMKGTITPSGNEKITFTKEKAASFIQNHTQDLIGLISFARIAKVLLPLTLDTNNALKAVENIRPVEETHEDGTAIGYALFKAANIIVSTKYFAERLKEHAPSAYTIQDHVIIALTDGLHSPHPEDSNHPFRYMTPEEALRYAKENNIRVYIVAVDPIIRKSIAEQELEKLQAAAKATGGVFFTINNEKGLENALNQISEKEQTTHIEKTKEQILPHNNLFIIAISFLLLSMLLETTIARHAP